MLPDSLKIWENTTLDAQGFNLDDLLMRFGLPFSINQCDHLNLLNCKMYNAKTFFYLSGHLLFASVLHHNFMFFMAPLLVAIFDNRFDFIWKLTILRLLQNPAGTKIHTHRPVSGVVRYKNVESARIYKYKGPGWISNDIQMSIPRPRSRLKPDFAVFVDTPFCRTKKHKKNNPAENIKNLRKCDLGCPRLQFGWLFDAIWTSIFDQFSWPPKSLKLQRV